MPFYRCNPKGGGGGDADYDSFYITVGEEKYLPTSYFVQKIFPNNYNTTFNDSVIIGNNISDCSNYFNNAKYFNNSFVMGKRVKYMDNMFTNCSMFNQPISISSYAVDCQYAFNACANFNQPIIMDNVIIKNAFSMFSGCYNLNQPINIIFSNEAEFGVNMLYMFSGCRNLNQPISMINGKGLILSSPFSGCNNLNTPINIKTSTINYISRLLENVNYNYPIEIGFDSSVNNVYVNAVIGNSQTFNSPVTFIDYGSANSVYGLNLSNLVTYCNNYNQPFTVPNCAKNLYFLFASCPKFNQPIIFEDCRLNTICTSLVQNCIGFNQAVIFPANVSSVTQAFFNCTNFGNSVYFKGNTTRSLSTKNMFANCNKTKRKTIWCNEVLTNNFLGNAAANSITGTTITWATITNGYYNATYNIYIYNNYEG